MCLLSPYELNHKINWQRILSVSMDLLLLFDVQSLSPLHVDQFKHTLVWPTFTMSHNIYLYSRLPLRTL